MPDSTSHRGHSDQSHSEIRHVHTERLPLGRLVTPNVGADVARRTLTQRRRGRETDSHLGDPGGPYKTNHMFYV